MTYGRLKATTAGLLVGDNVLPTDEETMLGLLSMAFYDVSTHTEAMHLLTLNRDNDVVRMSKGKYLVRFPELPSSDDDELDIDNELCFPIARLLASYVSAQKSAVHFAEASRLMKIYNSTVCEVLENLKEQKDGSYDINPTGY